MNDYHPYLTLKINLIKHSNALTQMTKDSILMFLLAFNVFESEYFKEPKMNESKKSRISVKERILKIQDLCNEKDYPIDLIENFHSHFSVVYIEKKWNQRFSSLCKSDDNIFGFENYEMDYLYDFFANPIDKNKEYAIKNGLLLCYKFTNNLFHGKKDIYALEKYNEDFKIIADFLISLMRYLNSIGTERF